MEILQSILGRAESIGNLGTGLGTLLLGLAATFALWKGKGWYEITQIHVAEKTVLLQQQEHHRRLKFAVAEEAVDLFHRVKQDFNSIRSPAVFSGESQALKDLEETNDFVREMKQHKDAGVVFMRLDERTETIAAINRLRPKFIAIFADDKPFEVVVEIRHKIWVAAQMLLHDLPRDQQREHEKVIWKTSEDDELSQSMAQAVRQIEELCYPVLRGELSYPETSIN